MDPNEALEILRDMVADVKKLTSEGPPWHDTKTTSEALAAHAVTMADAMGDLDEWLSKGGSLPSMWANR